jgi:hypothetical protein
MESSSSGYQGEAPMARKTAKMRLADGGIGAVDIF